MTHLQDNWGKQFIYIYLYPIILQRFCYGIFQIFQFTENDCFTVYIKSTKQWHRRIIYGCMVQIAKNLIEPLFLKSVEWIS